MLYTLNRRLTQVTILAVLVMALFGLYAANHAHASYGPYTNPDQCAGYDPVYAAEMPYSCSSNSIASSSSSFGTTPSEQLSAPQPMVYQVNAGDTLYKIARTFEIAVEDLTAINDIRDPRSLYIGQSLTIPGKLIDVNLPNGSAPVVSRVLMSTLTAYTAGAESTGKRPSDPGYGTTYSGSSATEGRTIAVDPGVIPLGATVFIDGIGVRKAEDIGSAIRGARIDVFMNDLHQAREFGIKKNVLVYVLSA